MNSKYQRYIDLIKANKNLILTGAPGTGKTFMAKEIAKAMGCRNEEIGFVQFHPSYDYTDFVEGLRPIKDDNGNVGFERKDGVFKKLCASALASNNTVSTPLVVTVAKEEAEPLFPILFKSLEEDISNRKIRQLKTKQGFVSVEGRSSLGNEKNLRILFEDFIRKGIYDLSGINTNELNNRISVLSNGLVQSLNTNIVWAVLQELLRRAKALHDTSGKSKSVSFDEAYDTLIRDLKDSGETLTFERPRSSTFKVSVDRDSVLRIDDAAIKKDLVRSFYDHTNTNNWYSKHCEIIIDYLREHYYLDGNNNHSSRKPPSNCTHPDIIDLSPQKKPFVFIIDEINRGEISKIFGELFFSIDPGYRGEEGKVQTQYQNMVEDGDVFKDGFYVPENVYIIGTMNDIDRSVESMDFAMRRRFAWAEVSAEESVQMLDGMPNEEALKNRMRNLNEAIFKTNGLGKAYQIGAAYFKKYEQYNSFEALWQYHLEGLLAEYLRGSANAEKELAELKKAYEDESPKDVAANNNQG